MNERPLAAAVGKARSINSRGNGRASSELLGPRLHHTALLRSEAILEFLSRQCQQRALRDLLQLFGCPFWFEKNPLDRHHRFLAAWLGEQERPLAMLATRAEQPSAAGGTDTRIDSVGDNKGQSLR